MPRADIGDSHVAGPVALEAVPTDPRSPMTDGDPPDRLVQQVSAPPADVITASLDGTERAMLNLLEDAVEDKVRLENAERAALNVIQDFDSARRALERVNEELRTEIAERERAEEALRVANQAAAAANRELEAFSYSVAHDLRAPLRSIDGFSQALVEDCAGSIPDVGLTYLGYIRESAQNMARLIDDLLSLSRVGRLELHFEQIDLASIARDIIARYRRDQPERVVDVVIPDEMIVVGDARLLQLALENLLNNAWKFTKKQPVAHIELGQLLQDGETIYFVRDNGAGFDMAYADKLFAVFQRLHSDKDFEGTGIGRANVHRIIQRHNGRIWAESEVGTGATFYFTLRGQS